MALATLRHRFDHFSCLLDTIFMLHSLNDWVKHWIPLIGILLSYTNCGADSICDQKASLYYLHAAADLIAKARHHFPSQLYCENLSRNAVDCSELLEMGFKKNGIYTIWPQSRVVGEKALEVYCDMETDGGGWTLIQKRGSFGRAVDYFYKDWKSYKEGFGDVEKEFWLGNDNIFALTNQRLYSARFDLKDVGNETRYAQYDMFWIDDEYNKYTLHIADYRGDAGDSMVGSHSNQKFSAKGEDNDSAKDESCVEKYKGGWWYGACHTSNLNGLNLNGKHESFANGINWKSWKGYHESMQSTEIKIRPRNFKLPHASQNNTPM